MTRTLIAAAVLGTSLTGCSTVRNLLPSEAHESPPWDIYGGTCMALDNLHGCPKGSGVGMVLIYPLETADVAASAVADTFTLPFTGVVGLCRLIDHVYHYYFPPTPDPLVLPPGGVILEGVPLAPPDEPAAVKPVPATP